MTSRNKTRIAFLYFNRGMVPLGPAYLMGQLDKARYDILFRTFGLDDRGEPVLPEDIVSFGPDVCSYTVISGYEKIYLKFNQLVKKRLPDPCLSVFGGPHVTFNPDFIDEEGVDAICRGEGDECLPAFLDAWLARDRNLEPIVVEGISTRYHQTAPVLVEDLDRLRFPDREPIYRDMPKYRRTLSLNMLAGRGCPFDCTYCFNSANHEIFKGRQFLRTRSPRRVIEEIIHMRRVKDFRVVRFMDDVFPFDRKWLEEFARLRRERIPDLRFTANFRVEVLNPENIPLLKAAGCSGAVCAIECANQEKRREILNRRMSNDHIAAIFAKLHRNGIRIMSQNMVGIPGTDLEDDYATLAFNGSLKPHFAWCSICQPYPKTRLYDIASDLGFQIGQATTDFNRSSSLEIAEREERRLIKELFSFVAHYGTPVIQVKRVARLFRQLEKFEVLGRFLRRELEFFYVYNEINFLRYFLNNSSPPALPVYWLGFAGAQGWRWLQKFLNLFRPLFGKEKVTRFVREPVEF